MKFFPNSMAFNMKYYIPFVYVIYEIKIYMYVPINLTHLLKTLDNICRDCDLNFEQPIYLFTLKRSV